jgi:hypothetical protein
MRRDHRSGYRPHQMSVVWRTGIRLEDASDVLTTYYSDTCVEKWN